MSIPPSDRARQLSAISNAITRLHRDHYGRGATTVRTIMQRNFVMCVLEDIYTPIERTLIDAGREDAVRETRTIFQDTMNPFILEPEGDDRAPEAEPLPTAQGMKADAANGA
jgi:Na+-translocating membrane potential-generating system (MpsC)